MSCGAALERRCPSCGAEVPPGPASASSAGRRSRLRRPAAAPAPPESGAVAGPQAPPEERRQVSVLFADLSGYTAYAERMDPEAVKSMLDRTLRQLGEQVERFGGTIDKYIGDNVMAVFGAPVAHEDDPERAVRAALAMQEAMGRINEGLPGDISFLLRVGINTGEVLAGQRRRRLHGHRRRRQRRIEAAGGGPPGDGNRRRGHLPRHPRVRLLRAARAARPEGQGRAGPRLGGARAGRLAAGPPGRLARRGPADRPRGGGAA